MSNHKADAFGVLLLFMGAALLSGCFPELRGLPTSFVAHSGIERPRVVRIDRDMAVHWQGGMTAERILRAGSVWREIGRIAQGQVMRPVQAVFTIEAANTHEAALVLRGDELTGFFLMHEKQFIPARPVVRLQVTEGNP